MVDVELRCVPVGGLCMYVPKRPGGVTDIFWTADGNVHTPILLEDEYFGDAFFLDSVTFFLVLGQPVLVRNKYWVPILLPDRVAAYASPNTEIFNL